MDVVGGRIPLLATHAALVLDRSMSASNSSASHEHSLNRALSSNRSPEFHGVHLEDRDHDVVDGSGFVIPELQQQVWLADVRPGINPDAMGVVSTRHHTPPPRKPSSSVINLESARAQSPVPQVALSLSQMNTTRDTSLRKKVRRLEKLADKTIMKRYEFEHEQQTLESCQDFVQQSTDDLVGAVDSLLVGENLDLLRPRIAELRSRCRTDTETFKQQAARVKELSHSLRQLECELKGKAERLGKNLDAANQALLYSQPVRSTGSQSSLESSDESLDLSSHSDTPTLLADYYDRKGDIGVFRERLVELEYNYHDDLAERELVVDRGDEPHVSDEHYYQDFVTQRRVILDDLSAAERDVSLLAARCEAAGLAIVDNRQESSYGALSSSPLSASAHNKGLSASQPLAHTRPQPRDGSFLSLRGQNRVRMWLDRLPNSDPCTPRRPTEHADLTEILDAGVEAFPFSRPPLERQERSEYPIHTLTAGDAFAFDADSRRRCARWETGIRLRRYKSDPPSVQLRPSGKEEHMQQRLSLEERWNLNGQGGPSSRALEPRSLQSSGDENVVEPEKLMGQQASSYRLLGRVLQGLFRR